MFGMVAETSRVHGDSTLTGSPEPGRSVIAERMTTGGALHESQERQIFLLRFADALRPLDDAVVILREASRLMGDHLRASRVAHAEDMGDDETVLLTHDYTDGVPSIRGRDRSADYGEALIRTMREGHVVVRPDIAIDPALTEAEKATHAALQLGATLNVPLVKGGQLVVMLAVHHATAHDFTLEEVALPQEMAERTWAAVERARAGTSFRGDGWRALSLPSRHIGEEANRVRSPQGRSRPAPEREALSRHRRDRAGLRHLHHRRGMPHRDLAPGSRGGLRWTAEEAVGQPIDLTFTAEDRAAGAPAAERQEARKQGHAPDVRWHLCKNGARVFIDGIMRSLTNSGGVITGFLKVGQD
ncbi:GAF domain-containing protein [Rubellimicrobium roseum]|nr:GAF domain-containing protein [Rubellimicrobium roseum]